MSSERVIEEIKQRLDIVDYIGRVVELKRAGRTYKACCPFHVEKTPSFVVFPHNGTWRCFGACSEGGDIFSFVQKREGLNFTEALQLLARQAGVELQAETPQQQAARTERDRLLALCEAAATQFQSWLRESTHAAGCRAYLEQRGLTATTISHFGLGYAPDNWDALLTALVARGYAPADMVQVGLVKERESGGYYDMFRHRLMIPIRDVRGRVIGFGARALDKEQQPKYINSPQTPLFDKGRTLYALELARDAIRTQDKAVIVEGYLDVITAHQHGFTNVVASLGTALTSNQIQLLTRYSPNLVLALDADEAGQRAAERGMDTVLEFHRQLRASRWEKARQGRGVANTVEGDVRVLVLPDGNDPDDLIKRDPRQWQSLIDNALPLMDFIIQRRARQSDLRDPVQKARLADELLPLVAELESALVRDHYLRQLARLLQTDERVLAQELVKHSGKRRTALARPAAPRGEESPSTLSRNTAPPSSESFNAEPPPLDESYFTGEEDWYSELPPLPEEGAAEQADSTVPEEPRTVEAYLLYLLLEKSEYVPLALQYGLRPAMWHRTDYREVWQTLAAAPTDPHDDWPHPLAATVHTILNFYTAQPALPAAQWETELYDQLDRFILSYEEEQARQVQLLMDDLQRSEDYTRDEMRNLQQHNQSLAAARFKRQQLRRERVEQRRRQPIGS